MNKKKVLITIGCIITLLLVVGISYAYWSLTFVQSDNNVVTTDCFEIAFLEGDAINLTKAYPISDENGLKNTPYTFTIKNVCDSSASYQINLETMAHDGKKLPDHYLKANLTESNVSKITAKLESNLSTSPTIEGAIDAYKLLVGILGPNETKTFDLRLWMHSDVVASDKDSMNATYNGRISIITSYYQDNQDHRGTLIARGYNEIKDEASMDYFWQYSDNITKVVLENKMLPKEDAIDTFDISESQDGSVMSYLVLNEDNETYTLYLQSDGGIIANANSFGLFGLFPKLENIEGLEYLDTSNVTNMSAMFSACSSLTSIDVSHFDTSKVTDMMVMFNGCSSLTSIDVSHFDTSNVTYMRGMFDGCSSLTSLDVSHFDTSKVTDMSFMFNGCSSLTSIDVSHFDTSNVTDMSRMFDGCRGLTSLDVSHFDTSNVTSMMYMFSECSNLINLNLGEFNRSNMTYSYEIFQNLPNTVIVKVSNESTRDWALKENSNWSVDNVIIEV